MFLSARTAAAGIVVAGVVVLTGCSDAGEARRTTAVTAVSASSSLDVSTTTVPAASTSRTEAVEPSRSECAPPANMPANVIVAEGVSCADAEALIARYLSDPRTQRGDRGAQMGEWSCNIRGAAEAQELGHVVDCVKPGATVIIRRR